jgi:hypothetical protein
MDIFQSSNNSIWNQENVNSKRKLIFVRFTLILIAFIAIWGVKYILHITGANLFDFVYIVIITQLALFGPVLIGLATDRISSKNMWLSIIIGLIVGFGSIAIGTKNDLKFLIDGAGTFTLLSSLFISYILSKRKNERKGI